MRLECKDLKEHKGYRDRQVLRHGRACWTDGKTIRLMQTAIMHAVYRLGHCISEHVTAISFRQESARLFHFRPADYYDWDFPTGPETPTATLQNAEHGNG